ncbi:transglycosylase domain-containing protein [Paenibacillus sp. D9]|uniref:transglycosylase domain-containing protein n=1 Tax=Paenibacillus TaxID=44249 RepID=UPI000676AAC6|nr:penicillin-binding protein 1A [Paenibacillus sp. D9]
MPDQRKKGDYPAQPASKKGKRKKGRISRKRKWFYGLFFAGALAVVAGIVGYLLVILNGERILAANKDVLSLTEASVVYDSSNNKIASLASVNRQNAEFSELPELLRDAFIATEDKRFEEHSGIDMLGIGRALVKDVIARSAKEGASTITQQLARNLFLNQDKTFFRKATEASIAVALENQMTKDEILTMYLNRIYFGNGIYGVKLAAKYYFNSSLEDLKLWQMATLAAIPKAPSYYNPKDDIERSTQRRAVVLTLMNDQGYITQEEEDQAKAVVYKPPGEFNSGSDRNKFLTYVDFAVKEAMQVMDMSEDEIRLGGYKIYTSLNATAQQTIEDEFDDDSNFEKSPDEQKQQAAMVIMDHSDGSIKAMIGGRDYVRKGLNRVTVPRQPGSSFKPITVYGPALETGDYTPGSTLRDDKKCYGSYCPTDSNKNKYIGPVSMSQSIMESRNASAVWLLNEIGVSKGVSFSGKLGMPLDKDDRNLAIALGGLSHGVTPLQMATAYSAFANDGKSVDAHTIVKIVDHSQETRYQYAAAKPKQLMKEQTAAYMTELLQGVVGPGGTGRGAAIDRPLAGKTGTTQHGISGLKSSYNRDAWFVGYTPEWTAAVWMGYDKTDKEHLLKKSSSAAAALFSKVMSKAMKDVPKGSFGKAPSEPTPTPPASDAPDQVKNLTGSYDPNQMLVSLRWTPVEGDGISYRIYRKDSSQAEFSRALDSAAAGSADDMNVAPGMSYEYYVTAYDSKSGLEGPPSARIAIEIPTVEISPSPTPGWNDGSGEGNEGNGNNGNGNGNGNNGNGNGHGNNGNGNGNNGNGSGNNGNGNGNNGSGNGNGQGGGQQGGESTSQPTPTPTPTSTPADAGGTGSGDGTSGTSSGDAAALPSVPAESTGP